MCVVITENVFIMTVSTRGQQSPFERRWRTGPCTNGRFTIMRTFKNRTVEKIMAGAFVFAEPWRYVGTRVENICVITKPPERAWFLLFTGSFVFLGIICVLQNFVILQYVQWTALSLLLIHFKIISCYSP